MEFARIQRLPAYSLGEVTSWMKTARSTGRDIINLGMGNPDLPTPQFIVDKLVDASQVGRNHRYSVSKGIHGLRKAMSEWYARHYDVVLDPDSEIVATMGSKEGLAHIVLAMVTPGDMVIVPDPTYPIHTYSVIIAGGTVHGVPITNDETAFLQAWKAAIESMHPQARLAILSFPANPTTMTVTLDFFREVVAIAQHYQLPLIHDLAYADLVFDDYCAPSILQIPGAKAIAVECYTMSKSYSMPGWRVAFCAGNVDILRALTRLKSYLDYGIFQPIQIAAAVALREGDQVVKEIAQVYRKRRDALCGGLRKAGWEIPPPRATMFVWASIPERFRASGSMAFAKLLLDEADVAVSPGIGFGPSGDHAVRFALVENEQRIKQAVRSMRKLLA